MHLTEDQMGSKYNINAGAAEIKKKKQDKVYGCERLYLGTMVL